jgi:hypothetical protein
MRAVPLYIEGQFAMFSEKRPYVNRANAAMEERRKSTGRRPWFSALNVLLCLPPVCVTSLGFYNPTIPEDRRRAKIFRNPTSHQARRTSEAGSALGRGAGP